MRSRLPWMTALFWIILAASPLGRNALGSAFFSGEQLSRAIWQPLCLAAMGVAAVTVLIEAWWRRRPVRRGDGG